MTIEETIERVEQLYHALTGTRPPPANGCAVIPPEADPIAHVHDQIERMLDGVEQLLPPAPAWTPRAQVYQHAGDTILAIDVPGVRREQLQIRAAPHAITVSGRRPRPARSVLACDAPGGPFTRTFPLATPVASDQISARLDDGVLTIRIHAATRAQPSQVSITS